MKKAYNFKLAELLEKQERVREITTEFKLGKSDPSRFNVLKFDKGHFKRFMNKKRNPNG